MPLLAEAASFNLMRSWLGRPLFWMVTGEVLVVACLLVAAVNLYQSQRGSPTVAPLRPPDLPAAQRARPSAEPGRTAIHPPASPAPGPGRSGAVTSRDGFPVDMDRLNRDQAALEAAQASAVSRLTAALRAYLERVVVPALLRAERPATATTPAPTQSSAASRKIP